MRLAFQRVAPPAFLGVLPLLFLVTLLTKEWGRGQIAPDFHLGLYRQAHDLLHTGVAFDPVGTPMEGQNRVYTVFTALLATPFTILPVGAADLLVTILLVAAALATVYVLGVRDWRVYGALFLWAPVLSAVQTGNLTLLLGLLAALAWRCRERRVLPGVLVGVAVAAKVFMWPLAVWLLATRRFSAAVAAAVTGLVSLLLIVPFGNPIDYFEVAKSNAEVMETHAYSVYVLLGANGTARAVWLLVGALVFVAALLVGDRASFTLAIVDCILFSPIVWLHYFALLIVPLAIARPRFGVLWLLPLAFGVVPFGTPATWQLLLVLGGMLVLVAALVVPGRLARPHALAVVSDGAE